MNENFNDLYKIATKKIDARMYFDLDGAIHHDVVCKLQDVIWRPLVDEIDDGFDFVLEDDLNIKVE